MSIKLRKKYRIFQILQQLYYRKQLLARLPCTLKLYILKLLLNPEYTVIYLNQCKTVNRYEKNRLLDFSIISVQYSEGNPIIEMSPSCRGYD